MEAASRRATLGGLMSVGIWSTSISVSRLVTEDLGVLPGTALVLLLAGLALLTGTTIREGSLRWIRRLRGRHLLICGPLFVGYILLLYGAVGLAPTRMDALVAGLANYLWPTMILLFSILVLKRRVRPLLFVPGVLISLLGIAMATAVSAGGMANLLGAVAAAPPSVWIGLLASVLWGLYSVLARVHPQTISSGAVGVFLLVAGMGALALSRGAWAQSEWTVRGLLAMAYMAAIPNSLAYWLWDIGVRDGDVTTLGAVSNLIPILSALVGSLVLGIGLHLELLVGACLVVIGAAVSRGAFRKESPLESSGA